MSWTTSTADLRTLLSDGPTDRYRFRKRVFGELNGTNTLFKTFEFRRVTDFTTAALPLGVFKNGTLLSTSAIAADYASSGEFALVSAPIDGDIIEASYYIQWFTDAELNEFLLRATNWLGLGDQVANVPDGLIPAAKEFAAAQAYLKMAIRWAEHMSEIYRVEDAPDKSTTDKIQSFRDLAEMHSKTAKSYRDDFYTRQGQNLQPLFGTISGAVRTMP